MDPAYELTSPGSAWSFNAWSEYGDGAQRRARTRSFRMALRQCPVPAVGDDVECLEYDLSDQYLAPGCSHDRLAIRRKVPDLDRDHCHRPFFSPFVRVDDRSRSAVAES